MPLEQSPHAVITDLGGGGMLGQEVLMNPLGRETVSRWAPRRLAISRQDSPADRSEWIASIIVIFSTFAMTGLLPRLCRWKTCRSECSVKMAGGQAPITGRLCAPTDTLLVILGVLVYFLATDTNPNSTPEQDAENAGWDFGLAWTWAFRTVFLKAVTFMIGQTWRRLYQTHNSNA